MAHKNKKSNFLPSVIKTAVIAGGAYLLVGEIVYEGVLNKKFINARKNKFRGIEPELSKYYDNPDEMNGADAWFVAENPEVTPLVKSDGETIYSNIILSKEPSDVWAIVVHGYTSCPRGMAVQAKEFHDMGYNVLLPVLRGHYIDEHEYCSMGYYDKDYIIAWIDYIRSVNENARILLLGVSMGSATVMMTTGEELPDNVKCAIADCGYTSCWDEYKEQIGVMFHLPVFPFLYAMNTVSKLRGNFNLKKCSPVRAVAKSKTPTLFIHGEKDAFVPYRMMDEVYNACSAEKEKLSVPDAMHAESVDVHPEMYWDKVKSFIGRYIK